MRCQPGNQSATAPTKTLELLTYHAKEWRKLGSKIPMSVRHIGQNLCGEDVEGGRFEVEAMIEGRRR